MEIENGLSGKVHLETRRGTAGGVGDARHELDLLVRLLHSPGSSAIAPQDISMGSQARVTLD